jgi:hypothetical protein
MIRSVAERGGGSRVSETPGDYLEAAGKVSSVYQEADSRRTGHHEPMIIAIGEYITTELRSQVAQSE